MSMKAIVIPVKGWGRGKKCAQCRRTIKPGEVGLVHRLLGSPRYSYGNENALWWHKTCVLEILNASPEGPKDYTTMFAELKEQAHAGELDY